MGAWDFLALPEACSTEEECSLQNQMVYFKKLCQQGDSLRNTNDLVIQKINFNDSLNNGFVKNTSKTKRINSL